MDYNDAAAGAVTAITINEGMGSVLRSLSEQSTRQIGAQFAALSENGVQSGKSMALNAVSVREFGAEIEAPAGAALSEELQAGSLHYNSVAGARGLVGAPNRAASFCCGESGLQPVGYNADSAVVDAEWIRIGSCYTSA